METNSREPDFLFDHRKIITPRQILESVSAFVMVPSPDCRISYAQLFFHLVFFFVELVRCVVDAFLCFHLFVS